MSHSGDCLLIINEISSKERKALLVDRRRINCCYVKRSCTSPKFVAAFACCAHPTFNRLKPLYSSHRSATSKTNKTYLTFTIILARRLSATVSTSPPFGRMEKTTLVARLLLATEVGVGFSLSAKLVADFKNYGGSFKLAFPGGVAT